MLQQKRHMAHGGLTCAVHTQPGGIHTESFSLVFNKHIPWLDKKMDILNLLCPAELVKCFPFGFME